MRSYVARGRIHARQFHHYSVLLAKRWSQDKVFSHAASLAYFSIFSLAPLIIICTSFLGLTFGQEIAQTKIIEIAYELMGKESAEQIQTMILHASTPKHGITAQIISFIILLIGASGIFTQTQVGLNSIFPSEHQYQTSTFTQFLIKRFFSLALVLGVAFLLLVSLVFSAILSFFSNYIITVFSMGIVITWIFDFLISFTGITFLFALIYRILPDIKLQWSEVMFGAMIAAFLFILGKFILGFYLGTKHIGSAFGPAGSLVIILIWLYYSAQTLFLGAELITIRKIQKTTKGM